MASHVLMNARVLLGGYDLSGSINAVVIDTDVPIIDVTTIDQTWTKAIAGMKSVQVQVEGFWEAGTANEPDNVIWSVLGVTNTPISFIPNATEGTVAYSFLTSVATYTPSGSVGDVMKFSVSAEG